MANKIYGFIALTGGGTGALDRAEIDGDDLVDKDIAIGVVTDTMYAYILDADSAAAESSPDVIAPDTNAGDKRWLLITKVKASNLGDYTHPNHSGDVTSVADGAQTIADAAVTLAKMANLAANKIIARVTQSTGVPETLEVTEATIVGRSTGGALAALTATAVRTILNVADGPDVTGSNHPKAHTASHAVSGADTVFPADPGADRFLKWNDSLGVLEWSAGSVASGDISTDTIWAAAGDLVVGTGEHTAVRLAKGIANQVLRMKSDASTVEWTTLVSDAVYSADDWNGVATTSPSKNAVRDALEDIKTTIASALAADTLWDAAGDLVVGTGVNTAARLAKGTASQVLSMKSDASTIEWRTLITYAPANATAANSFLVSGADPFAYAEKSLANTAALLKGQFPQAITDNHVVTVDSASAATGEYAKFTGNGLESKSIAEVQADLLVAPGTIGGTTPGVVYATMKEIYKTSSAASPLTALQVSRTIVSNYGMTDADCVISLPTAAEGYTFICILPTVRAKHFKFRADTNDKIYLSGVAGSNNAYVGVASGYATGASCQMFTFKASDGGFDWFCIPIFGTWVAS